MKSKASNSVMTRARAGYGSCLNAEDYGTLAGCASLAEIVSHLRTSRHFAAYFEKVPTDATLSREIIEYTARQAFFNQAQKLCGFEKSVGTSIFKYIAVTRETELILDYIINLSLGTPEKMIFRLPEKYNCGTKTDFSKLFQIRSVDELKKYLSKTGYAKLVPVLPLRDEDVFDVSLIETTLGKIKYKLVLDELGSVFPGETAKTLSHGILMRAELYDINVIYRAKKYFGLSDSYIRTNMVGCRCLLTAKAFEKILTASCADEVIRLLGETRYGAKMEKYGAKDFELFCRKAAIGEEIKQIHFSAEPAVVLSAYLRILEAECDNIIKIVEGVTYRLPKEEILAGLIIPVKGA